MLSEQELVRETSNWVRWTARKLAFSARYGLLTEDDLYQAGMIGVVQAYRNCDHKHIIAQLIAYAQIRAKGAMIDALREVSVDTRGGRKKGDLTYINYLSEFDNFVEEGDWEEFLSEESVSVEDIVSSHQTIDFVSAQIAGFSLKKQKIITGRISGLSLKASGQSAGVTESRASQIWSGFKKDLTKSLAALT